MVRRWVVGAVINISGSIAINLGTNLMKLSHKVRYPVPLSMAVAHSG